MYVNTNRGLGLAPSWWRSGVEAAGKTAAVITGPQFTFPERDRVISMVTQAPAQSIGEAREALLSSRRIRIPKLIEQTRDAESRRFARNGVRESLEPPPPIRSLRPPVSSLPISTHGDQRIRLPLQPVIPTIVNRGEIESSVDRPPGLTPSIIPAEVREAFLKKHLPSGQSVDTPKVTVITGADPAATPYRENWTVDSTNLSISQPQLPGNVVPSKDGLQFTDTSGPVQAETIPALPTNGGIGTPLLIAGGLAALLYFFADTKSARKSRRRRRRY